MVSLVLFLSDRGFVLCSGVARSLLMRAPTERRSLSAHQRAKAHSFNARRVLDPSADADGTDLIKWIQWLSRSPASSAIACDRTGLITSKLSNTPLGEPGRFTISAPDLIPQTPREIMAIGVFFRV